MAGNEKLNVFSDAFDALSALYAENIKIPWKKAPILDNVGKFETLVKKSGEAESVDQCLNKEKEELKQKKEKAAEAAIPVERKIALPEPAKPENEPDDGPVTRLTKNIENVLTLIETAEGPLAFLKNCMQNRIRVKVWTRNHTRIRGYSEGFVVAFDKHWNIALEDVHEIWTRRRKRKIAPLGNESEPPPNFTPVLLPPAITIVKRKKKTETCKRQVNQMMIRGEHVVLISVISS